jgi:hypothetical protein
LGEGGEIKIEIEVKAEIEIKTETEVEVEEGLWINVTLVIPLFFNKFGSKLKTA